MFFEPGALWSDSDFGVPPPFPHDDDVVFAPHIYRGGLTGGPVPRVRIRTRAADAATFGGAPVYVGEWGSGPERAEDPADVYFRSHQQLQDEFHFSAALWTWRESCGDPHKAGDARAGRIPSVWGEFEVDCRTNTVVGTRDALLDQLTRAYVRAAPGELVASTYDPATGTFRASGRNAPEGAQLWTWYPPGQAPPDAVTFAVSATCASASRPQAASTSRPRRQVPRGSSSYRAEPVQAAAEPAECIRVSAPAGWYPDPAQQHEQRYWDGMGWTEHVFDPPRPRPRRHRGTRIQCHPSRR